MSQDQAQRALLEPADPRVVFGTLPPLAADRLSDAMEALDADATERCEDLLWEAHRLAPDALAIHFELYRLYLCRDDVAEAERVALLALAAAARVGGFTPDWKAMPADGEPSPARLFALVTLKTLAQLRMRQGAIAEAAVMLDRLEELDPLDTVGHGAVAALFGWPGD
jgi:hypothetical protein